MIAKEGENSNSKVFARPDHYGLNNQVIRALVLKLPNVDRCINFQNDPVRFFCFESEFLILQFLFIQKPKKSKKQTLADEGTSDAFTP